MIKERDLFNYIFHPEELPENLLKDVEGNPHFTNILDFYRDLKESMFEPVDINTKRKLSKAIPDYHIDSQIILDEVKIDEGIGINGLRFAAACKSSIEKVKARSFINKADGLFVRWINCGDSTQIFIFSRNSAFLENFRLTFMPSNKTVEIKDNSNAIILDKNLQVESIIFEFI